MKRLITFSRPIAADVGGATEMLLVVEGRIHDSHNGLVDISVEAVRTSDGATHRLEPPVVLTTRGTAILGSQTLVSAHRVHAPRQVSCGCCTGGCACATHAPAPGTPATCDYHAKVGHTRVTETQDQADERQLRGMRR